MKQPLELHSQIIHFVGGQKRYITGITRIWENEMTHLLTLDGTEWIINKNNVLCVERVKNYRKTKVELLMSKEEAK